jgi:hydroxyethylthiazole kinase-like uncharacterized protein yjeF
MKAITKKYIRTLIKARTDDSHKGTYGHSLLIAGNTGTMGAVVIAAKACLRTGTGLLTVNVPEEERFVLQIAVPEAMVAMRKKKTDLKPFSAIGIGPGLGTSASQKTILETILKNSNCPLVLDADALNILANNKALWKFIPASTIITPHPKEFDRLFGTHHSHEARIKQAIAQAKALNLIIVLKGHRTLVTSGTHTFYNTTGNAGLAKGGSGDALTGMITAFLAQGLKPLEAATAAVYLHGLAADLCLKEQSMETMIITDVIDHIGRSFYAVAK